MTDLTTALSHFEIISLKPCLKLCNRVTPLGKPVWSNTAVTLLCLYTALSMQAFSRQALVPDKVAASNPYNKKGRQYDFMSSKTSSELAALLLEKLKTIKLKLHVINHSFKIDKSFNTYTKVLNRCNKLQLISSQE